MLRAHCGVLLYALASVQAAVPPCTWDSCPVCLENAKPAVNMSFVARDGLAYTAPMRIAGPRDHWDSLGVVGRAFGILVKERLGVNVAYTDCRDSTQCLLAAMGCVGWATSAACRPTSTSSEAREAMAIGVKTYPDPLPDVFVVLEQWPSLVNRSAGTPAPESVEDHGMTGYPTDYNVLVSGPLVQTAWRDYRLDLLGYRAYMLPDIASVFSSPAELMADSAFVPTWGTACPGTNGSKYPSSALRFVRDALYPHGWVCRDGWWLAPACAELGDQWASQCVPLIQPDRWYASGAPAYYGVAVAGMRVASVPVTGHLALLAAHRVLFLGWSPGDLSYRALDPQAVLLYQWENTTSRTLTTKSVWAPVVGFSAQVAIFIRQFAWSAAMLDSLLADMEAAYRQGHGPSDEAQPGFYQKVACDWLRGNAASWEPLLPDPTSCAVGHYFDPQTSACTPCPPGTKWVPARKGQDTCALCAPGETQDDPGRTECAHCSRGSYSAALGLSAAPDACPPCELGRYSRESGSTACEVCPHGQSTLEPGSYSPDQCICAAGQHSTRGFPSLQADGEQCAPCDEGMECGVGQVIPGLKPGYYSSPEDPLRVYRCTARVGQGADDGAADKTVCLGGWVGNVTCKDGRSGFLCQTCPDGMVATQTQCISCSRRDYAGLVLCALTILAALLLVLAGSLRSAVKDDPRTMGAGSLFMQAVNFVQVLAAIQSLGASWGPPLADLLQALSIYTLDLDVIRIGCASLTNTVGKYAFKMSAPLCAVCALILLVQVANVAARRVILNFDATFNAVGQVLSMTFISISLASLTPFQCFHHPHGQSSLVTVPTVMCWHSKEHKLMVSLAVTALFVYVLSTAVLVLFAILRYPSEILKEDLHFVRRFRFLFFRFQPEHYWYAGLLMARNFSLALFPMIVPPEMQGVSLILMQLTIVFCCMISVRFFPWRGVMLNWSDMAMNMTLQGVLIVATLAFTGDPMSLVTSSILCAFCGGGLLFCASAVLWKLSQRLLRTSDWALFLSHHKLGGACTARFLKAVLQAKLAGQVFLDCDDLASLWSLLDAVRSSKALLVLLSPEVLNRPWCVGEIITAHQCSVPILLCTAALGPTATLVPVQQLLRSGRESISSRHDSLDVLRPHGISPEHADAAFEALLSKMVVHLDFSQSQALGAGLADICDNVRALAAARARRRGPCAVLGGCDGCGMGMTMKRSKDWDMEAGESVRWADGGSGRFWLALSDPLDVEAAAAARVVKVMIQPKVQRPVVVDTGTTTQEVLQIFRSSRLETVVWLVTRHTFRSAPQLARLAALDKLFPAIYVLPVIIGDRNATLPGPEFYAQLEAGLVDFGPSGGLAEHAPVPVTPMDVSSALQHVFMHIATCVDIPSASEQMLATSLAALIRNAHTKPSLIRRIDTNSREPGASPPASPTARCLDVTAAADPAAGMYFASEGSSEWEVRTPAITALAEAKSEFWDDSPQWF